MTAPLTASARVTLTDADRVTRALLAHLESHAEIVHVPGGARILSAYGTVLLMRERAGLDIEVLSPTRPALATVRTFLADHIHEFSENARIVWSGDGAGERQPQQFQKLQVIDAFPVTPRMRRILFSCENIAALADDEHHHIRLLIPPQGRAPVWPGLKADGRLEWPAGADALTNRVYTIRGIDIDAATIAVDVALHPADADAPGAGFAQRATPGDPAGLLGPGGSGLPRARRLLLLGDETAMPAIARIAEQADPGTSIDAVIAVEDASETAYLAARPGLTLTWLCRSEQPQRVTTLADALEERLARAGADPLLVWAGCEQGLARQLRQRLKQCPGIEGQIAAYWRRNSGA